MARLEDKISPSALLLAVKSGRLKDEIVREYKASEEEIAMMLLPLYRSGELTKQQFNRFFRGVPIFEETQEVPEEKQEGPLKQTARPPQPKSQGKPKPAADHTDPPSEIFRVFSSVFSRKSGSANENGGRDEKPGSFSPPEYDEESSIAEIDPVNLDDLSENQSLRIDQEELERLEQEETERVGFGLEPSAPYEIEMAPDSPDNTLDRINETLASIQKRLDHIEKKLGIS